MLADGEGDTLALGLRLADGLIDGETCAFGISVAIRRALIHGLIFMWPSYSRSK